MPRHPSDPELLLRLGRRIHALRDATGRSQEWLAERVRLSPATVSRFEQGRLAPTLSTADKLARALGVSLPELFAFDAVAPSVAQRERRRGEALLDRMDGLSPEHRALVEDLVMALAGKGEKRT